MKTVKVKLFTYFNTYQSFFKFIFQCMLIHFRLLYINMIQFLRSQVESTFSLALYNLFFIPLVNMQYKNYKPKVNIAQF